MAAITHNKNTDFHWTAADVGLSILFGLAAAIGIWLGAGLLMMLFLL